MVNFYTISFPLLAQNVCQYVQNAYSSLIAVQTPCVICPNKEI